MMCYQNLSSRIATVLADEMVTLKDFATPFVHLKRIPGALCGRTNATFPAWVSRATRRMQFGSIAYIESLSISEFGSSPFGWSPFLCLREFALSFIRMMFAFHPWGNSSMRISDSIFYVLRSMSAEQTVAFPRYGFTDSPQCIWRVMLPKEGIGSAGVAGYSWPLGSTLAFFPELCFQRIFRNWHIYSIVVPSY